MELGGYRALCDLWWRGTRIVCKRHSLLSVRSSGKPSLNPGERFPGVPVEVCTRCAPGQGAGSRGFELDVWIRPLCAFVVAGVAAYASYAHQWEFALRGGPDTVSASLWPLSVNGPLLLATAGLLKPTVPHTRRARGVVWAALLLGIAVSLAANITAAPALEWQPVLVAGWPPVALLLSVELLVHRRGG
jgi:hypothetical protein